jgi:hypothetical protein
MTPTPKHEESAKLQTINTMHKPQNLGDISLYLIQNLRGKAVIFRIPP